MDKKLAHHVVRVAFRTAAELQALLVLLREQCEPEEYKKFALSIAGTIDAINVGLTDNVLTQFPEMAAEIEADLTNYGRVL